MARVELFNNNGRLAPVKTKTTTGGKQSIMANTGPLRIPTGGRLTSWLFTQHGGVEFGATEDKSIQRQGGGFEPGTSGLQDQRPTTRPRPYPLKTVVQSVESS